MVGPVQSLSGMRNLLGDELENVGVYAQRLLESGHPVLKRTRGLVVNMDNGAPVRGLMILLLSRAIQDLYDMPSFSLSGHSLFLARLPPLARIFTENSLGRRQWHT